MFVSTPTEEGQWPTEEIQVADTETGFLEGYLLSIGRDNDGKIYALTTENLSPTGETGEVLRLRPPAAESTPTVNTETPSRPPTVTATAEPTPTAATTSTETETATATESRTSTVGTTDEENGTGSGGVQRLVRGNGPGFNVLAAVAAITGIVARFLSRDQDQ